MTSALLIRSIENCILLGLFSLPARLFKIDLTGNIILTQHITHKAESARFHNLQAETSHTKHMEQKECGVFGV